MTSARTSRLLSFSNRNTLTQVGVLSAAFAVGAVVSTTLLFSVTGLLTKRQSLKASSEVDTTAPLLKSITNNSDSASAEIDNSAMATDLAPSEVRNSESQRNLLDTAGTDSGAQPAKKSAAMEAALKLEPATEAPPSLSAVIPEKNPAAITPIIVNKASETNSPKVSAQQDEDAGLISYKLVAGDTLTKIWTKNGSSMRAGLLAGKALEQANIPVNILKQGDEVKIKKSVTGDISLLQRRLKDGRVLKIEAVESKGYKASLVQSKIVEKERKVSGTIKSSFSLAANEASVPYQVVDELVDLFSARLEFRRDLQPGDSFTIFYTERRCPDGTLLDPGAITSASIQNNGKLIAALNYSTRDGKTHYYDETGHVLGNTFLRYPLQFSRITSVFSNARFHPILNITRPHNGVDFAAPIGTPVRSVGDGVVVESGYKFGAGKVVMIAHGSRYSTAYMHLSAISTNLRKGTRVSRGQLIGSVGMTGFATGPHLHFSLFDNGVYVDPLKANLPTLSPNAEQMPIQVLQAKLDLIKLEHESIALAMANSGKKDS